MAIIEDYVWRIWICMNTHETISTGGVHGASLFLIPCISMILQLWWCTARVFFFYLWMCRFVLFVNDYSSYYFCRDVDWLLYNYLQHSTSFTWTGHDAYFQATGVREERKHCEGDTELFFPRLHLENWAVAFGWDHKNKIDGFFQKC